MKSSLGVQKNWQKNKLSKNVLSYKYANGAKQHYAVSVNAVWCWESLHTMMHDVFTVRILRLITTPTPLLTQQNGEIQEGFSFFSLFLYHFFLLMQLPILYLNLFASTKSLF